MESAYLLRVRLEDQQAIAAVGPLASHEAYAAQVEASGSVDESHTIVLLPANVLADITRSNP